MKGSCVLVTSVLAASLLALSSSSGDRDITFISCSQQEYSYFSSSASAGKEQPNISCAKASAVTKKFAPRFDGLRFIETLITAHR